jgi:hypothetical protein
VSDHCLCRGVNSRRCDSGQDKRYPGTAEIHYAITAEDGDVVDLRRRRIQTTCQPDITATFLVELLDQ